MIGWPLLHLQQRSHRTLLMEQQCSLTKLRLTREIRLARRLL